MTTEPATRRSIIAVWHWPRWVWGLVVPLMIATYILSAGPVWAFVELCWVKGRISQVVYTGTRAFYLPVWWCASQFKLLRQLLDWELDTTARFLRFVINWP